MRLSRRKWPIVVLSALLLLVPLGLIIWAEMIPTPMDEAFQALEPSGQLAVQTDPWLVFRPTESFPAVGLIFYPGARVDYRAYAPAARAIAEQGFLVVVAPMPLNLPVLAPNRASDIQSAFPEIQRWAVGGHSLGGAMAAQYAAQNLGSVQGLVLWAAYPPSTSSLRDASVLVVSVYGSLDGLATTDKIRASQDLLPEGTQWVQIAGGNHAQFGWYGPQNGDNAATISRSAQQEQAIGATLGLLRSLGMTP